MRYLVCLALGLLVVRACADGHRWEVSTGRAIFPTESTFTSGTASLKIAEKKDMRGFFDVGYALGKSKRGGGDAWVVGASLGQRRERVRYGVQYNLKTEAASFVVRLSLWSF